MLVCLLASVAGLGLALPALGQRGPESLLPPGFDDPPAPPAAQPGTQPPDAKTGPTSSQPKASQATRPARSTVSASQSKDATKDDDEEGDEEEIIRYDVPPTARRSLKQIGLISENAGGFPDTAFGGTDGAFLTNVLRRTHGPLASRWGMIMTRRLLASRLITPENVNGADWVAERSWLALRMGDALVARQLVQQVDSDRFSQRLYTVAMPVFLANGDLSGMCPTVEEAARQTEEPTWRMATSICASLAGEQGRASSLLNQGRRKQWAKGIDLLLTEKAVGAGTNGRRAVSIKWDNVTSFNVWRHGLAVATGLEAPERLYDQLGKHVDGWRAQLPMISDKTKMLVVPNAASLGTLSNKQAVDLYSAAIEGNEVGDDLKDQAELLRQAYTGSGDAARVSAMRSLWDSAKTSDERRGLLVLTARAAAMIAPGAVDGDDADWLIASMMTAGLDNAAVRWGDKVGKASLGWGILAAGAPGWSGAVDYGALDDFYDNDDSENYQKTALLAAGLGGLGRSSSAAVAEMGEALDRNLMKQTSWSKAIGAAAARGESGTVVLLAAAALQAPSWSKVPPHHLYHIVKALKTVGLDAEARMIAAEAVSFG
jgi:hypothetical protein